jgi:hypothetical protein
MIYLPSAGVASLVFFRSFVIGFCATASVFGSSALPLQAPVKLHCLSEDGQAVALELYR